MALYLPAVSFDELPFLIFGATSIASAIIALYLPETLGAPLVESLDELLLLKRYSKPILSWWSSKQVEASVKKISSIRASMTHFHGPQKNIAMT